MLILRSHEHGIEHSTVRLHYIELCPGPQHCSHHRIISSLVSILQAAPTNSGPSLLFKMDAVLMLCLFHLFMEVNNSSDRIRHQRRDRINQRLSRLQKRISSRKLHCVMVILALLSRPVSSPRRVWTVPRLVLPNCNIY